MLTRKLSTSGDISFLRSLLCFKTARHNKNKLKLKNDHSSKFPTLAAGKKKPEKKYQGFNGIRTRDPRDTDAMLYQLSYEATHTKMSNGVLLTMKLQLIKQETALCNVNTPLLVFFRRVS